MSWNCCKKCLCVWMFMTCYSEAIYSLYRLRTSTRKLRPCWTGWHLPRDSWGTEGPFLRRSCHSSNRLRSTRYWWVPERGHTMKLHAEIHWRWVFQNLYTIISDNLYLYIHFCRNLRRTWWGRRLSWERRSVLDRTFWRDVTLMLSPLWNIGSLCSDHAGRRWENF